jgi:hypothetical protein
MIKLADSQLIKESVIKLKSHIELQDYHGYDPYDILKSPLFRVNLLKSHQPRFLAQQFGKRFPFHLQRILNVPKGLNPVTLGLCIQGLSYMIPVFPDQKQELIYKIDILLDKLVSIRSDGSSGISWGYDFDWEARYTKIDSYVPTSVATGIITNALFESNMIVENNKMQEIIVDASKFILNDLNRTQKGEAICFSYSPNDRLMVLNASMKAVRLLSQAYYFTKIEELRSLADKAVLFLISNQDPNGSWVYSLNEKRNWPDNYHTGYNLDCLDSYIKLMGREQYKVDLEKGIDFYENNYFGKDGAPRLYIKKSYPYDSTSAAQSLLSLSRFGKYDLAQKVATWSIHNLQSSNGGFYYRKNRLYTDKRIFMRWNNAWMFAGLTFLLFQSASNRG